MEWIALWKYLHFFRLTEGPRLLFRTIQISFRELKCISSWINQYLFCSKATDVISSSVTNSMEVEHMGDYLHSGYCCEFNGIFGGFFSVKLQGICSNFSPFPCIVCYWAVTAIGRIFQWVFYSPARMGKGGTRLFCSSLTEQRNCSFRLYMKG